MIPDPGVTDVNMGGRIIPRSVVSTPTSAAAFTDAIQFIAKGGNILFGVTFDVAKFAKTAPSNAVLPAWRDGIFDAVFGSPIDMISTEANVEA